MGRPEEFCCKFHYGQDDAGSFHFLIAEAQLADGLHSSYFKILRIIAVIDDVHLVSLGISDTDLSFACIHLLIVFILPSHHAIHAETAGAYQKDGGEGSEIQNSELMMLEVLAFMK